MNIQNDNIMITVKGNGYLLEWNNIWESQNGRPIQSCVYKQDEFLLLLDGIRQILEANNQKDQ